jgi:pyruvate kinase
MVARGDLGVEVPIEEMAILQKRLIARAVRAGRPVITATQMLESMTHSRLPTRAEATVVANAILDGTDCLMLSGESAMGRYPDEAVAMLAKIAAHTETHRPPTRLNDPWAPGRPSAPWASTRPSAPLSAEEASAAIVQTALESVPCAAIFAPTRTGTTARMISRFRPPVWIAALSKDRAACRNLAFSYGVHPVEMAGEPEDWRTFAAEWLREHAIEGDLAMLVAGPSERHPEANHRLEFLRIG